jgi:hypothetical protein
VWPRAPAGLVGLALLAAPLFPAPAVGQQTAADSGWTGIELTPRVQSSLHRLQELWLQWTVA